LDAREAARRKRSPFVRGDFTVFLLDCQDKSRSWVPRSCVRSSALTETFGAQAISAPGLIFPCGRLEAGRAGLRRYGAALGRLRNAYHSLDPAIRPWFSLAETAYVAGSRPSSIARSQKPKNFSPGRHRLRGAMPAETKPQWPWRGTCSGGGDTTPVSRAWGSGHS
jgi:hypothetical protein